VTPFLVLSINKHREMVMCSAAIDLPPVKHSLQKQTVWPMVEAGISVTDHFWYWKECKSKYYETKSCTLGSIM